MSRCSADGGERLRSGEAEGSSGAGSSLPSSLRFDATHRYDAAAGEENGYRPKIPGARPMRPDLADEAVQRK